MGPGVLEPAVGGDVLSRDDFDRAWRGGLPVDVAAPTTVARTQLTILRNSPGDFRDRQIYLWVDDESWGKLRYDVPMTREVPPGPHRIRVNNTLFTHTLDVTAVPGEHVRVRCTHGMPTAGWLFLVMFHATYLRVRLEREL